MLLMTCFVLLLVFERRWYRRSHAVSIFWTLLTVGVECILDSFETFGTVPPAGRRHRYPDANAEKIIRVQKFNALVRPMHGAWVGF